MNFRDFFFQLLLFFAGAAIGVIAALLPRNKLRWAGWILSACFIATSLIWLGYELGNRRASSPELLIVTTTTMPSTSMSTIVSIPTTPLPNNTSTPPNATSTSLLLTDTPVTPANTLPSSTYTPIVCTFPSGETISPESLARVIGGEAQYWTLRGKNNCVWGYWNKDGIVTFHHPGGNTILTYWKGFGEPRNSRGCWIVIPAKGTDWDGETKTVQCPEPGAEFEADGVGFHPNP